MLGQAGQKTMHVTSERALCLDRECAARRGCMRAAWCRAVLWRTHTRPAGSRGRCTGTGQGVSVVAGTCRGQTAGESAVCVWRTKGGQRGGGRRAGLSTAADVCCARQVVRRGGERAHRGSSQKLMTRCPRKRGMVQVVSAVAGGLANFQSVAQDKDPKWRLGGPKGPLAWCGW